VVFYPGFTARSKKPKEEGNLFPFETFLKVIKFLAFGADEI